MRTALLSGAYRRIALIACASERDALAVGYGLRDGELCPQDYEWYVTLLASSVDATVAIRNETLLGYDGMGAFSWGFWEEKRNGYRAIHHGGVMAGYSNELYLVPEAGLGFFVACNRDFEAGPPARLREAIADLVYDRVLPDRRIQTPSLERRRLESTTHV